MKILLIGNISSGKSTIGSQLTKKLNDFDYVSIDSIRKTYGDGSEKAEEECKEIFLQKIEQMRNQIIEVSGIGKLGESVIAKINKENQVLILNPRCSAEAIESRNDSRKWETPFPYSVDNIPIAVNHTRKEFSQGVMQKFLDMIPNAILYSFSNENQVNLAGAMKDIFGLLDNMRLSNGRK